MQGHSSLITIDGSVFWFLRGSWAVYKSLYLQTVFDLVILLLGIYSEEKEMYTKIYV